MTLLSEADYRRGIVELARDRLGYKVRSVLNARTKQGRWTTGGMSGWPDLTLIRPPRIVFAELKGPTTPTTDEQHATLALLRACGLEAYLWRSGETSLQEIAEMLARREALV